MHPAIEYNYSVTIQLIHNNKENYILCEFFSTAVAVPRILATIVAIHPVDFPIL